MQPERTDGPTVSRSYLHLLRMGFTKPQCYHMRWCALTAPFQLFSQDKLAGVFFSVALIRRVAPPSR